MGYSSLTKGYKCLHVSTNRVYINRDVIFDENVFPFANLPSSDSSPSCHHSPALLDQFEDRAYAPLLLANHGAGVGHSARLELLPDGAPILHKHVDPLHGVVHDVHVDHASAADPAEPLAAPGAVAAESASPPLDDVATSPPHVSSPASQPLAPAPAIIPTGDSLRSTTRSMHVIYLPKVRTNGIVAWLAVCMAQATSDPTSEPRHFCATLSIPHWCAAMEQEYDAFNP